MKFVKTDRGYVNLDHVAAIRWNGFDHKHIFFAPDGEPMGSATTNDFSPTGGDLESSTIVPATPGTIAMAVSTETGGERPTIETTTVRQLSVIAWRIDDADGAIPVFAEPKFSNEIRLIAMPDGKLCDLFCWDFDTIDEAVKHITEDAAATWDAEHATKATAA